MQTKDVTVRLSTLDGVWETVGVDRLRGVMAENVSLAANEWGSSKASFDLKRAPGSAFPDLGAFTPVEVEVGGVLVWSGRIAETPISEASQTINVQAEGWQFHLDDDVFAKQWVHTKLSDFVDTRSIPSASLAFHRQAYQVTVGDGAIVLGFPQGSTIAGSTGAAATLDLGEGRAKRVVCEIGGDLPTFPTQLTIYVILHDTPSWADSSTTNGTREDAMAGVTASGGSQAWYASTTATNPHRYVTIMLYDNATAATLTADHYLRFTAVNVFADAAYETGHLSNVTADIIVNDALDLGTILLSPDRSGIDVQSFALPEFGGTEQRTPREFIMAANAVEDCRAKIDVRRRMIFQDKPESAAIEIGQWPGSVFDDASANSGDDIYNRVIVEGQGADKEKVSVERTQGQQAGVALETISSPAADNPSFATNTTSWTASAGTTITRDTSVFDTAPARGVWSKTGGLQPGDSLVETFTGTFQAGLTYVLTFKYTGPVSSLHVVATLGVVGDHATVDVPTVSVGFGALSVIWSPTATTTGVTFTLTATSGVSVLTGGMSIDSLSLAVTRSTLVDRRGFKRTHILPVECSLTPELGQRIGDIWLAAHKTTPLKGTVQLTGDRACREILTGAKVPPERLLLMTGDMIRLSHRTDPDTGGHGRDGRIAEVTYAPENDTATVAIDSTRNKVEALLKRLAVVVGSH